MFFPRLITFLIAAFCSFCAWNFGTQEWFIPITIMRFIAFGASVFFATSAFLVFIGTFGMKKDGFELEILDNPPGKAMRFVLRNRRLWLGEVHCCDIFVDTSRDLLIGIIITTLITVIVIGVIVNFIHALIMAGFVACVVALFWGASKLPRSDRVSELMEKAGEKLLPVVRSAVPYLKYVGFVMIGIVCCMLLGILCILLYLGVYTPIMLLISFGYSVIVALGIYFGTTSIVLLPLYCVGGKKLIARYGGRLGDKVCPVVRD